MRSGRRLTGLFLACSTALSACSCSEVSGPAPHPSGVVAEFAGASLTREDVLQEASRLPPALRDQFDRSPAGRSELARSMIDKRLLVEEARRRGLADDPELRKQVRELEERLLIQTMLAAEERAAGPAEEHEARAYFEANSRLFLLPEKVRLARLLVARAGESKAAAHARAESLRKRLLRGESMEVLAAEGDGPERLRGGDLGLHPKGTLDPVLEAAAGKLESPGDVSPVIEGKEGLAILALVERQAPRLPSFEEAKKQVYARLEPIRKRQVFDGLLEKLRKEANVVINVDSLK